MLWIAAIVLVVILLVWHMILRPYGPVETARDLTYIYEYLKRDYVAAFDGLDNVLLTTAIVGFRWNLKKGRLTVDDLEEALTTDWIESCEKAVIISPRIERAPSLDEKRSICYSDTDVFASFVVYLECFVLAMCSRTSAPDLTDITDLIECNRPAIRRAIEKAKQRFTAGKMPSVERNAVDNFMFSPTFHSTRVRVRIANKVRMPAELMERMIEEITSGAVPGLRHLAKSVRLQRQKQETANGDRQD